MSGGVAGIVTGREKEWYLLHFFCCVSQFWGVGFGYGQERQHLDGTTPQHDPSLCPRTQVHRELRVFYGGSTKGWEGEGL